MSGQGVSRPASPLGEAIAARLAKREVLLMTHLIVGYPSLDANRVMLERMAAADVDLIELQLPFSEPVADGPTFVRANQEALAAGLKVGDYFRFFEEAGQVLSCPRLLMGYYNTVYQLGHAAFCERMAAAGGSGMILPDLPIEEYGDLFELSEEHGLDPILLMTPTSSAERLAEIGARARGFIYAVARKGVTGSRTDFEASGVNALLARCRNATDLPLALGFGLSSGDDLKQLHGTPAQIGIVGSALLRAWEEGGESAYTDLVEGLAAAR